MNMPESEPSHHPNILLFISDQQRTDTLGCYGNPWIRSPHQDALAARSFLFENTYVTQPVCTPARGSLITGLYPHTHGCMVNRDKLADRFASLAEMLPDSYRTAHFGKWHLGDDSTCQHGFDEWVSSEDDHRDRYTRPGLPFSSYYYWMREQGIEPEDRCATGELIFSPEQRSRLGAEHQMAAYVAGHAERFIRANSARPWLLVFSTFEPHPPMHGPYNGLYDARAIPNRPTFQAFPEGHSLFNRSRAGHHPNPRMPGESWRDGAHLLEQRANYYGNVKIIDDAVGRMVRVLEESGQMDRTIFAFTSDHGEMLGDHSMMGKRAFYDESARVPLLLSVPWLTRTQRRFEGVFGHADLVPTLLDLAGLALPDALQGRSLAGALNGDLDLRRHVAFMEWKRHRRPRPGQPGHQPYGHPAVAQRRHRGRLEAEPVRRRPIRAIRPERRPLRADQPVRPLRAARPGPRAGGPHPPVAGRDRRHRAAPLSLRANLLPPCGGHSSRVRLPPAPNPRPTAQTQTTDTRN